MRAPVLAWFLLAVAATLSGQALGVLRITVVVADADGTPMPVPRHALLISDNPPTSTPRRVVTGLDGTVEVKLRPGNYTVESDRPTAFRGKAYQWTQILDIVAGRDATLELTAANADADVAMPDEPDAAAPSASDPEFLLPRWQDSVVAIWTPATRASGFVIDAKGLVATSHRAIGAATMVEVQVTSDVKVAARVLAADEARDAAVLWIDPAAVSGVRPVQPACAEPATPAVADRQELFTIGAPLREPKGLTPGTVRRAGTQSILGDFRTTAGASGGPVFTADGGLVGLVSFADDDRRRSETARIVGVEALCAVLAAAEKAMPGATAPEPAHRPVDPTRPFPIEALKSAVQRRAGNLNPRQIAGADFDVAFITPVLLYGEQTRDPEARARTRGPLSDFGSWSDYVEDVPPVLLIRVTPKLVEGFWTTVARGAARVQGMSIPPIKRFTSGFSRMRVFCGDTEVTPIHPFTLEQRISESVAIHEGLYAFDPGALGPHCKTARVMLYSEKAPDKADVRAIESSLLQDIWEQFEPYRALQPAARQVR